MAAQSEDSIINCRRISAMIYGLYLSGCACSSLAERRSQQAKVRPRRKLVNFCQRARSQCQPCAGSAACSGELVCWRSMKRDPTDHLGGVRLLRSSAFSSSFCSPDRSEIPEKRRSAPGAPDTPESAAQPANIYRHLWRQTRVCSLGLVAAHLDCGR